jgi:peptide/nickel transport system permease protein
LELVVIATVIALITSVTAAVLSASRAGRVVDVPTRMASMVALSLPSFILALALSLLLSVHFRWFPSVGFVSLGTSLTENIKTMVLPALSISFLLFGSLSRILRADLLQQLNSEDYVLTARSKGASEWRILTKHLLKNSLFSLITVVGTNLGVAIGGSVIVEGIFDLPGMGQLLQSAILSRDTTTVLGVVVVVAVAVVLVNFLTDMAYMLLDPRVRYDS